MSVILFTIPSFVASLACFDRIQEFVESTDHITRGAQDTPSLDDSESGPKPNGSSSDNTLISTNKASFWAGDEDTVLLHDISISIAKSSLVAVLGPVGSGKSVLLRGLLGELRSKGISRVFNDGIAYCAQTTWLANSSIRQNILGVSPLDEAWYYAVVEACALDQDFKRLSDGDLSTVGSKGLSLSGGQKQRIVSFLPWPVLPFEP